MVGLIAMQPDFGSILILTPLVILIYFVGGGNPKYILVSLAIAAI
jgi:cell division protein FtsW (lipid II flippase)